MTVIELYEIVDGLLVGPKTTREEIIGMNQYDMMTVACAKS